MTELLARVGGGGVGLNCRWADKEAAMSTWLWVLIVVVVLVLVFGVMRRGAAHGVAPRPGHRRRSCWSGPTAWRGGRWVQAQRAQPTT